MATKSTPVKGMLMDYLHLPWPVSDKPKQTRSSIPPSANSPSTTKALSKMSLAQPRSRNFLM